MDYIKINEYPLERLSFGDNDYYDVDYFDGVSYQSAKIKGSVIRQAILNAVENFYNTNGVLTDNRTVDGNNKGLDFQNLDYFQVDVTDTGAVVLNDLVAYNINPTSLLTTDRLFTILDVIANKRRLAVLKTGEVAINEAYKLPLLDGTSGQIIQTDGAGNLTFVTPSASVNIYNTDGTLTGNRTIDGNSFYLAESNLSGRVVEIIPPNTPPFNEVGYLILVETTNLATGEGRLLEVRNSTNNTEILGVLETGEVRINSAYKLPNIDGVTDAILTTDGAGNASFKLPFSISSTQWSNTLASPVTVPSGTFANGFNFFTDANKVASGTTSYNEFNISYGRKLTLTGTSGTANISYLSTNYPLTFSTDLNTTAQNWVNSYGALFEAIGIQVFNVNGVIRFGSLSVANLNNFAITNTSGTLSGTLDTPINDHVVIPYVGTQYEGYRIHHTFRINFNLVTGNQQYYRLALVRWANDTIVGSYIIVERNNLLTGYQYVFESYTAGATDPFVTGGFYFALFNDTGQNVQFTDGAGILIQNTFQKPINF